MKQIIKDKDSLIHAQQRALNEAQRSSTHFANTFTKEMQNFSQDNIIPTVEEGKKLVNVCQTFMNQKNTAFNKLGAFKEEYQKVLEIKADITGAYDHLNHDLRVLTNQIE